MAAAIPREGLEVRLSELKAQKLRIEGHIEEIEFLIAQCVAFEVEEQAEEPSDG